MVSGRKKSSGEKRGVLYSLKKGVGAEAIKLRRDATIFGREKGDIVVRDDEVSSTHCQIQNLGDVYHIFDMNSTNGTWVNNERVIKSKLAPGDVVTIGQTSFRFQLEDEASIRHLTTIFRSKESKTGPESRPSLVDTLIENELRSTQPHRIFLSVKYHDGSADEIELNQRVVYVGRASSFGKFEQDPEISRKHLLIKVNDTGEIFIEDQDSTNGSFLNGKKITGMHIVRPQDEVRVGVCLLRISSKRP